MKITIKRFRKVIENGFDYIEGYITYVELLNIFLSIIIITLLENDYPYLLLIFWFNFIWIITNMYCRISNLIKRRKVYYEELKNND